MKYVLVTVTGGIIERVTLFDSKSLALRVLEHFVMRMNPEEDDASVYSPRGLVANAKDYFDEDDPLVEHPPTEAVVSDKEKTETIYLIGNPVHWLGFMVVSSDDPLGFKDPVEAVSELGQIRKDAGNHLKLYRDVPVEGPIVTGAEIERYNAENEVENFSLPLVQEYIAE